MKKVNIFEWAIETTKNSDWANSRFHDFQKTATQEEFLKSQEPFFYAVRVFPRLLCFLAGNITTSEDRLKVVTNIWEEHGMGKAEGFHTNSYITYLKALGYESEGLPSNDNPWIHDWIRMTEETCITASAHLSAAYLSGVEYAYALICTEVVKYIDTLDLKCEQTHYKKHSELDWEHGRELLEVAVDLASKCESDEIELKYAFLDGQQTFIRTYNSLFMPTSKQMQEIGKEKIAFYYSRESSQLEVSAVEFQKKQKKGQNVDVLMIASGGEHIFEILQQEGVNVHAIDINPYQIELAKEKLQAIKTDPENPILSESDVGKFEKMFALLRSYFTNQEIYQLRIGNEKIYPKLKFVIDHLFSNESLNKVFTEQATKYTTKSFALHFFDVFAKTLNSEKIGENISNIFFKTNIRNWKNLSLGMKENSVEWTVDNPKDFVSTRKYDVIDISNIGDWMSQEDFSKVLNNMKKHLNPNGFLLVRKLLGDYHLYNVLTEHGFNPKSFKDETMFYSECYSAVMA